MVIKHGCFRTVLLIGRYAIKLPRIGNMRRFVVGILANIHERDMWRYYKHPRLCPVLFSFAGLFIVMPRCAPAFALCDHLIKAGEWSAYNSFVNVDGLWKIPVENKLDSFGALDGRIVALDYGNETLIA